MNKILEYQEKERELIDIKKKIRNSSAMKVVNQVTDNVKNAKNELKNLDKIAGELFASFIKWQNVMNDNVNNIQYLERQKVEDEKQFKTLYANIQTVNNNLNIIEKHISDISKKIESVLIKYQKNRNIISNGKNKRIQAQDDVNKIKQDNEDAIDKVKSEMENISKEINSGIMEIYQKARKEKVFPVYVPVIEDKDGIRCGFCKTVIPVGKKSKLKEKGTIECEECRRINYIKN